MTSNYKRSIEAYNNPIRIGLIIPSRVGKCKNFEDIIFLKIMLPSFLENIDKTNKYIYTFYIGYDYDDECWVNNQDNIKNFFDNNTSNNINIVFFVFDDTYKGGKIGKMWSTLAEMSVTNGDEYLYQLGDDIKFLNGNNWEDKFIDKLKSQNNIGAVGPSDVRWPNRLFLTQSFVHKTHLDIFNTYYPPEIINWYIDGWITDVYGDYTYQFQDINIQNMTGDDPRYEPVNDNKPYKNALNKGKDILNNYLIGIDTV